MIHLPPLPVRDRASKVPATAGDDPCDFFAHNPNHHPLAGRNHPTRCTRMVSYLYPESSILIYIDGSCLNQNSSIDAHSRRAGCAVVYGTHPSSGQTKSHPSISMFRLENQGPDGNYHAPTSNRAELRQPCNQATIFLVVDSMVEAKAPQPTICQPRDKPTNHQKGSTNHS